MSVALHRIKDAALCAQSIQRDVMVIKHSVGLSTAQTHTVNLCAGRAAGAT
ncbi:hypothetical protein QBC43DRAFT_305101 [Cladorrhinum sp. PSN259]|nr:hypothetical protein QBC43DRAFT_305101 [Cladorrhinum sp. PSN259]